MEIWKQILRKTEHVKSTESKKIIKDRKGRKEREDLIKERIREARAERRIEDRKKRLQDREEDEMRVTKHGQNVNGTETVVLSLSVCVMGKTEPMGGLSVGFVADKIFKNTHSLI